MKYSGLRDRHLNVFINYAANGTDKDGEHLENNITKAFINTLESLPNDAVKSIFRNILKEDSYDINLPEVIKCEYYLQWESTNAKIKELIVKIPESNRLLLAFSPTGKHWDVAGSDTKDYPTMKKAIEDHYKAEEPDISSDELRKRVEYRLKEIEKLRTGKSIPDGLIIILDNSTKPLYAIALENKKYDLDPYQLNNHLEKSLELHGKEKGKNIIYRKYTDIIDAIKSNGTYMTDSFIEYMAILGYYEYDIDMFSNCFLADKSIRQRLCFHYGKDILESIKGCFDYSVKQKKDESGQLITYSVDKRDRCTWRLHVNYRFLKEINLIFKEDTNEKEGKVYVSLAFASRQNAAKEMYSSIDAEKFKNISSDMRPKKTFHLQYFRGKNIGESYIGNEKDGRSVYEYIKYWQTNLKYIKGTRNHNPEEIFSLYDKMISEGIINEYDGLKKRLSGKKNDVLVIPEIVFEPEWTYEEIGNIGKERFIKAIKERIAKALELFDLPTKNNS